MIELNEIRQELAKSNYTILQEDNVFYIYYEGNFIGLCEGGKFNTAFEPVFPGFTGDEMRLVAALADYSYNYYT